jgi:predicted ATP-grasp superfamily ATP-dependent carboligase
MKALIVELSTDRASLAAARALAADGWEVGSGAWRRSLTSRSRYVSAYHSVPPADDGDERFIPAVAAAVAEGGYDIVFSADDSGVLSLARNRERIGAVVPYGSTESVERALDKSDLAEAAARVGLVTPPVLTDAASVDPTLPVVVKGRRHEPVRFDAEVFPSLATAQPYIDEILAGGGEPQVQRFLEGRLDSVTAVVDRDGNVVCALQQRGSRIWPPGAGSIARTRSVTVDEELLAAIRALLADLGWFGLAQLQFMVTPDEQRYLIDLNGRFYASIALAYASGVNVAAVWARLALGLPVDTPARGRTGLEFQWLARDLKASASQPGLRAKVEPLLAAPRTVHTLWAVRDPWPAVAYTAVEVPRRLLARIRKR